MKVFVMLFARNYTCTCLTSVELKTPLKVHNNLSGYHKKKNVLEVYEGIDLTNWPRMHGLNTERGEGTELEFLEGTGKGGENKKKLSIGGVGK